MTKYVAVKTAGVIKVHLPHTNGNYYTLCGEDGDDPSEAVDSVAVEVPKGAKVDCVHCLRIWEVCKEFTAKDFAALTKRATDVRKHSPDCSCLHDANSACDCDFTESHSR